MIKKPIYLFLSLFQLFCNSASYAMKIEGNYTDTDEEILLRTNLPSEPTFFGLKFKTTPKKASNILTRMGLHLTDQRSDDPQGVIKVFSFRGIPKDFTVREGTTRLIFLRNQLVRIDLFFDSSYRNFLILKNEYLGKIPDNLTVNSKREVMDSFLKTELAHLKDGEFNSEIEKKVEKSIADGKTFYYYQLQDNKNQMNATYSYSAKQSPEGIKTGLQMHFSIKDGMEDLQEFHLTQKNKTKKSSPKINHTIKVSNDYP